MPGTLKRRQSAGGLAELACGRGALPDLEARELLQRVGALLRVLKVVAEWRTLLSPTSRREDVVEAAARGRAPRLHVWLLGTEWWCRHLCALSRVRRALFVLI